MRPVKGATYRVTVAGAIHQTFSDSPLLMPGGSEMKVRLLGAVRTYLVAFFDKTLKGGPSSLFDAGPSKDFPEVTIEVFRAFQ